MATPSDKTPQLPRWWIESLLEKLAPLPAALGKALDRMAQAPFPLGSLVRFFSSIWLGILWLFLTGLYIGLGSGLPKFRAQLELSDMAFFNAWPMVTLMLLVSLTLTVVTLRRIPLNLYKLGVWCVHLGILVLIGGCFAYFSQKQEGSARVFLNQSVSDYYDAAERALYIRDPSGQETMLPLPKLPIYHEHLAETGNPLAIPVPLPNVPNLQITGFYPYAEMRSSLVFGPENSPQQAPGVLVGIKAGQETARQWLVSSSPAARVLDQESSPIGMEYLYHPSPQRLSALRATLTGNVGVVVRIPKLKLDKTYTILNENPIAIEGTPYQIKPLSPVQMPMLSKGYEGAQSSGLTFEVQRTEADGKIFTFQRMAMFRYPERSPDFISVNGKNQRVQDRVDQDLELTYLDASRDQFWIIEHGDGHLSFMHRQAGGAFQEQPLTIQQPAQVKVGGVALEFTLQQRHANVQLGMAPQVVPVKLRSRASMGGDMSHSILELTCPGAGRKIYVPFVAYANTRPPYGLPPTPLEIPGQGNFELVYSTTRRALPSRVTLQDFKAQKYPGALNSYQDYISTLSVEDRSTGRSQTLIARLNSPAEDYGLYYFQSGWDGDDQAPPDRRFSVLGIANRPGITTMTLGSLMIMLGIAYAFYVKPILQNIRKKQLAAQKR